MKEPAPCKRAMIITLCTVILSLLIVDYSARNEILTLGALGLFAFLVSVVAMISFSHPYRNTTKL